MFTVKPLSHRFSINKESPITISFISTESAASILIMDPFTLSTRVAGFLSLALEISKILDTYVSDIKSAREDAEDMVTEVDNLCHVLDQLVQFLRNDVKRNFEPTFTLHLVINSCQEQFQDLYKKLGKIGRVQNKAVEIIERMKWPFRKDEYQGTVAKLHQFTQTFQFSLQVLNW
jgi:hypothetical protein